ncbi:MAG TPA: FecR domain-containing protein [Polyangia bacterium]|nr:FecR domain-containing protein [Polyangia bacterium]
MKRGPIPPTPPLADAAVARIERGLFAALDARPLAPPRPWVSRRSGLAFALAGVAAAAAVFAVREGRRGETLPARAQLSTTTSGSRIAIGGATLDVAPQSAISFGGGRGGAVVVVLDRGTVTCEVAPRAKRAPFVVEAGATRVTVIGTRFSVHRIGEHATVSVDHGLVEVADTNMTELVHAGERYAPGEAVTREPLASAVTAPAPVATTSTPPLATPAAGATAHVPAPEDPTPATRPRHPRRVALSDAEDHAPTSPRTPMHDGAPAAGARTQDLAVADRPAASGLADASAAKPSPDTPLAAQRRSVQVLYELAAQLEIRDPEAALRIYGELAAGDDGWAASALFASARLESERGQAQLARELCETYLRRFPRGPNADDARTLLAPAR